MVPLRQWAEIMSEGKGEANEKQQMHVNLKMVVDDEISGHPKFERTYEARMKFHVVYSDMEIVFEQKGWTIHQWILQEREDRYHVRSIKSGLVFGSEGVLEIIKQLRAEKDGVKYEKPKPKVTKDPMQALYEMERFKPRLEGALRRHPLFNSCYMAQKVIFVVYWDILFSITPDDWGNYSWELYERLGKVETKLCKCGRAVGDGGLIDTLKHLRSCWDATHDPPSRQECEQLL